MPKPIPKNIDVVHGAVPDPTTAGYTDHDDPSIMPRRDKADSPGTGNNDTAEFSINKGVVKKGKPNVFSHS